MGWSIVWMLQARRPGSPSGSGSGSGSEPVYEEPKLDEWQDIGIGFSIFSWVFELFSPFGMEAEMH